MRVALVTCHKYPGLTESDRVLAQSLAYAGAEPVAADWRDPRVEWATFDVAVLRSTWDYHLHSVEFSAWVAATASRTTLLNPAPLVRWNMNKRYLEDLAARDIPTLPFIVVEPGAAAPMSESGRRGWSDIVIKPLIGASAWQIARAQTDRLEHVLTPELRRGGYLMQPFAAEINRGEHSLVFIDGAFSHAVLKSPRGDDFRTQPELGGSQTVVTPDSALLASASAVLEALPERPVYARIDGIVRDGRFMLMEAELIEPELYFHLVPEAAKTFARLLVSVAKEGRQEKFLTPEV